MVTKYVKSFVVGTLCLGLGIATPSFAQQNTVDDADSFTSENAILDTSILFAIGAREARQELRGSFGWPTFQEGLVEGVYFRFDPDGYARFSTSPRLDADVFEVICRPRTYSCMGRKNGLAMVLNSRGVLQLRFESLVEGDQFFVADGITELQMPQSILQPLEPRLELLLSSGGELVIKRRDAETDRISLSGFGAVAAYLRWINARQDYIVLPRGWPVPNSDATATGVGLTQAANWQSPMPQPLIPQETQELPSVAAQGQIAEIAQSSKDTFELLKDLADPTPDYRAQSTMMTPVPDPMMMAELKLSIDLLIAELRRSNGGMMAEMKDPATLPAPMELKDTMPTEDAVAADHEDSKSADLSERLQYLIEEIGLPADLALVVAQQGEESPMPGAQDQTEVVGDILNELKTQLQAENAQNDAAEKEQGDYKLLSEYFRSVSNQ